MRGADREEIESSRVHALRHLQRYLRARQLDPADVVERAAHSHRRRARARRVAVALEPQQERVAAELEQAGAVLVGDLQDRREAAADRVGDLFRALAALARELLGELREPGDVGEHRGAGGAPGRHVRIGEQMQLEDAREVRDHAFGVFQRRRCGRIGGHRFGIGVGALRVYR